MTDDPAPDVPYEPPAGEPTDGPELPAGTLLTASHVREKTFSETRFKNGYDEDEVDAFLDEVEHTLTVLHQELASLRTELAVAGTAGAAAPAPVEVAAVPAAPATTEMEEMLRRTLMLAQRTADQAVAEAREQAETTLAEARAEATRVVTDARGRAEAAEREAAVRSTAMLSESDSQRRSIESKVEALRSFEREYRSRLRAYFELQLRELEGIGTPGGAPPAPAAATVVDAPAPAEPPALSPPSGLQEGPPPSDSTTVGTSAPPVPGVPGIPAPPPVAPPTVAGVAETTFADLNSDPTPAVE